MAEDSVSRITLALPKELRYQLQDTAFLLKRPEAALAQEALKSWLDAVAAKKGEKFQNAMEIIKEARET